MTAPIAGHPRYDFKTYSNENGGVARIAQVEDDGEVVTHGGQVIPVKAGDYITDAGRPDQYAVIAREDFGNWSEESDADVESKPAVETAPKDEYDPSAYNVTEVRDHLNELRATQNEEEFNRILAVEAEGKNRAGVTSETF